jgi:hypothetical protein
MHLSLLQAELRPNVFLRPSPNAQEQTGGDADGDTLRSPPVWGIGAARDWLTPARSGESNQEGTAENGCTHAI